MLRPYFFYRLLPSLTVGFKFSAAHARRRSSIRRLHGFPACRHVVGRTAAAPTSATGYHQARLAPAEDGADGELRDVGRHVDIPRRLARWQDDRVRAARRSLHAADRR